jgi:hypothetical protein
VQHKRDLDLDLDRVEERGVASAVKLPRQPSLRDADESARLDVFPVARRPIAIPS